MARFGLERLFRGETQQKQKKETPQIRVIDGDLLRTKTAPKTNTDEQWNVQEHAGVQQYEGNPEELSAAADFAQGVTKPRLTRREVEDRPTEGPLRVSKTTHMPEVERTSNSVTRPLSAKASGELSPMAPDTHETVHNKAAFGMTQEVTFTPGQHPVPDTPPEPPKKPTAVQNALPVSPSPAAERRTQALTDARRRQEVLLRQQHDIRQSFAALSGGSFFSRLLHRGEMKTQEDRLSRIRMQLQELVAAFPQLMATERTTPLPPSTEQTATQNVRFYKSKQDEGWNETEPQEHKTDMAA